MRSEIKSKCTCIDTSEPKPKKVKVAAPTQLAAEMPAPTTLEEALKIIDMLKAEQTALVEHIAETDPNSMGAPPHIKAHLKRGKSAIFVFANAIGKNMEIAYNEIVRKIEEEDDYNPRKSGITQADFSMAMFLFIANIGELVAMETDDEVTKLRLAYDLLMQLKDWSMYDLDVCLAYEAMGSDEDADQLLVEIIRKRNDAGDVWDWKKDQKNLEDEAEGNAAYGIEPWYPKSIKALAALSTQYLSVDKLID